MGVLMHCGFVKLIERHLTRLTGTDCSKSDPVVENEPFESGPLTISLENGKWVAKLDDTNREGFVLTRTYIVDSIEYNRTPPAGKVGTMCVPFAYNVSKVSGAKIYKITALQRHDDTHLPAKILYAEYPENTIVPANMPVVIIGDGTGNLQFGDESFEINQKIAGVPIDNYGVAYGSYSVYKVTEDDPNLHKIYGFAARDRVNQAGTEFFTGDPVRAGVGASIPPFKCYVIDVYPYDT